jgi:hypothetical protein
MTGQNGGGEMQRSKEEEEEDLEIEQRLLASLASAAPVSPASSFQLPSSTNGLPSSPSSSEDAADIGLPLISPNAHSRARKLLDPEALASGSPRQQPREKQTGLQPLVSAPIEVRTQNTQMTTLGKVSARAKVPLRGAK